MKLRNKILAMAVVAVAGVNVYLANDVNTRNSARSLLNLENIAEAQGGENSEGFIIQDGEFAYIVYNAQKTKWASCYKNDPFRLCRFRLEGHIFTSRGSLLVPSDFDFLHGYVGPWIP